MRSPFYFIVKPEGDRRYANTRDFGGVEFIVSTSEEDHKFSNRVAEVISTPAGYGGPIKSGDRLIVHHNAFKFYNDIKGRARSGRSFLRDGLFFVDSDQFFMYGNESGWHAHDRYCFVSPMPAAQGGWVRTTANEPLQGVMEYTSEYLASKGIYPGDIVCFTPDSEYEFEIDGRKMYRVFDHQITMKL